MLNLLFAISDFGFDFMNVFIYIILSLAFANGIYEYNKKNEWTAREWNRYGKYLELVISLILSIMIPLFVVLVVWLIAIYIKCLVLFLFETIIITEILIVLFLFSEELDEYDPFSLSLLK